MEQKKQEKLAAIFSSAEELFLSQGYHSTTIEQIARKAGVSVGSVYVYFRNKEGLCLALLDKALDVQERYLSEAIDRDDDPVASLRRLGRAYLRFFLDHPRYFKLLMFLEHGGLGDLDSGPSRDAYAQRTERQLHLVASLLLEGIQRGHFREVNPMPAAQFLWGSWTGVISLTGRTGPTRVRLEDLPHILEMGADLVLNGLLQRGAT
jgi:TetR/AcrR family transcriptional regulator